MAKSLYPFRFFFILLICSSLLMTAYCLFNDSPLSKSALEPSIIGALWGLIIMAFIQLFQTLPPPILPHDGFFTKIATRFKLLLVTLLAIIVVTTTILLFWMSIRLLLL